MEAGFQKPFGATEDMPDALKETLGKVKKDKELADRTHRVYRERWDEMYGLWRNYRRLQQAVNDAPDRDQGGVLLEGLREWGADLFIPYAFATIETVVPRILSNDPTMRMRPRHPGAQDSAKAVEELINNAQLEIGYELKLQPTARRGLMYGLGVQKTFWNKRTKKVRQTVPSQTGQGYAAVEQELVTYEGPDVEDVDIWDFFWDPVAKSIETCRFVIHRTWRDFAYIKRMVEQGKWFPLDLDAVKGMQPDADFAGIKQPRLDAAGLSGVDLKDSGMHEVWEYHDGEKVHTVLDGQLVVQSADTPFYHRELPFQIYRPTMAPGEFVGVGAIEPMKHLQYELNTMRGQRRDNATVALQRPFLYREGRADPRTFKMGPSVGIPVMGDPKSDIVPLEVSDLPGSAYQEEDAIKSDIERVTGISDPVSGGQGDGTGGSDTATGIQLVQQAANVRIRLYMKNLEREIVRPAGRQFFELFRQHMLEQQNVRIEDPNTPEGYRFQEVGPEQLLDDIDGPIPDAGSTEPDDPIGKQQTAQSIYQEFQGNPQVDQRKLVQYTLSELGVPNPESFLAPEQIMVDPTRLAQVLQEGGPGPYDEQQILEATQAVIEEQQAEEGAAVSG